MNIIDRPDITSVDFLDYLKGLKDFALVIKEAADETIEQNQIISDRVTAKISRRANLRRELLGKKPVVQAKRLKNVIAIKKKTNNEWYVYDRTGKKKLGGPYASEKEADKRMTQVESFKSNSNKKSSIKPESTESYKLKSSDVYALSGFTSKLAAWAKLNGGSKIRSYAHSINTGMQQLSNITNASLKTVAASGRSFSGSDSSALSIVKDVHTSIDSLKKRGLDVKSAKLLDGIINDITGVKRILAMRNN